ncbi:hypothetical protein ACI51X_02265 [Pectobacterium versatile]|uniref:hypothetical protein n=1 Tax=Pectobacterium versatile TaxID=2488639 RepID=UPI000D425E20|nr:hypothetical protein [Pectobacterium versatile]MBA0170952.1 hypothetical protein [Pectobacterium versatile]POY52326.1 hypothetical protein F018LOC_04185 [Pectobacterium versatile]
MQKSICFVRDKPSISLCHQHHARLRALSRRSPENPGFLAGILPLRGTFGVRGRC